MQYFSGKKHIILKKNYNNFIHFLFLFIKASIFLYCIFVSYYLYFFVYHIFIINCNQIIN